MTIKSIATTNIYNTIAESVYDELLTSSSIFYTYIGRIMDYVGTENIALDNKKYENIVRNNIVYLKRVNLNDISHVIKRIDWNNGTIYDMYDDEYHGGSISGITIENSGSGYSASTVAYVDGGKGRNADISVNVSPFDGSISGFTINDAGVDYSSIPTISVVGTGTGASATAVLSSSYTTHSGASTLRGANFYVLTTEYNVYKCLDNNNNAISTIMPAKTALDPFILADGYMWKFMYHIPASLRKKFLTLQNIPVFNVLTSGFYSNGGIDYVSVTDGGSGYTSSGSEELYVVGDGTGAVLSMHASAVSKEISSIDIANKGIRYLSDTNRNIISISKSTVSSVCTLTITTEYNHRLVVGVSITISNADSDYNATYIVNTITSPDVFTVIKTVNGTGNVDTPYGMIGRITSAINIQSVQIVDNIATVTTVSAHSYNEGNIVSIVGTSISAFNTKHIIEKINNSTSFTISFVGSGSSNIVGNVIQADNCINSFSRTSNIITLSTKNVHNFFAPLTISSVSVATNIVTVTSNDHGLRNGHVVTITGTTSFDISATTISSVTANTFTYSKVTSGSAETVGYINCPVNITNLNGYTGTAYSIISVVNSKSITFSLVGSDASLTNPAALLTYKTTLRISAAASSGIGKYVGNTTAVLEPNVQLKRGFDYTAVPTIIIPDANGTYANFTGQCGESSAFTGISNYVSQFVGSISGGTNQLVITSVSSGVILVGQTISGNGITAGTTITGFVSGTNGNSGTYTVSTNQTFTSTTIYGYIGNNVSFVAGIATTGVMTISTINSGVVIIGQTVTGANIAIGTTITGFVSGINGGVGVYTLSWSPTVAIVVGTVVVGSIVTNKLLVTAKSNGTITVGQTISGVGITAGTTITEFLYGTIGSVGIYSISSTHNISSAAITATKNNSILTVSAVSGGTIEIGQTIAGTNIISGTIISGFISGTLGGTGTYNINNSQFFSSTSITVSATVTVTKTADYISNITIAKAGSGYITPPTIYFNGGSINMASATASISSGAVTSILMTQFGSGYNTAPTIKITGGNGTGATAVATISKGLVVSILITNSGSGYTVAPLVYFSGTSDLCCSATAILYKGKIDRVEIDSVIDSVKIVDPGKGYLSSATASITVEGDGTGAVLTPYIKNNTIKYISIDNKGEGYTYADLTVIGNSTVTATAIANINTTNISGQLDTNQYNVEILAAFGAIHVIKVVNGGTGYINGEVVKIIGDGGSAEATVIVDAYGVITKVTITNYGYGYNIASASVVSLYGSGANLRPIISPVGGHGKNAIVELYADNLMFFTKLSFADTYNSYPITNNFYQYGLFRSPNIYETSKNFTGQLGCICYDTIGIFNSNDFPQGGTVKIIANNIDNLFNIVELKTSGMLLQQQNINSYIPFIGDIVTNISNNISFTITNINYPTVDKFSGDIIDINNVNGFNKTPNQIISLRTLINI